MGDGGVACVPVQHIMERFSVCGGKTKSSTFSTSSSNSTSRTVKKMNGKMKAKRDKGVNLSSKTGGKDIECNGDVGKDEVEEGELGTLPVENGELVPEKPLSRKYEIKSEIEKGEITSDVKRGEFVKGRWRKGEWEKGDYISDKSNRKGELDKNDPGYEPGEFVPDRWQKGEGSARDDFNYSRTRRHDFAKDKGWKGDLDWTPPSAKDKGWRNDREWTPPSAKDKGWRNDREWTSPSAKDKGWRNNREWTPPSAKDKGWRNDHEWTPPSSGKHSGEKDVGRSGGIQHVKRLPRYEPSIPERNPRISSKIVGEEGSSKSELRNGNNPAREYFSGNRLKRHGTDSDKSDRKYRGEFDDFSSSKSRKLSDDGSRAVYTAEHGLRRSTEKLHKNAPSNRNIPSDRYSSRHYETSKVSYDRLNSSPRHSERSPRDRARHLDNWDRSPARQEKSPYDRGRHFDHSRSPYDRSRHYDHRSRSPSYSEWSPQDQGRQHHRRDRTPNFVERSPRERGRTAYHRDMGRKSGPSDKRESHFEGKRHEGKCSSQKDVSEKDQIAKDSEVRSCPENSNCSIVKSGNHQVNNEGLPQCPAENALEPPEENGAVEEVASMEEDMDICNTPPHVPTVAEGTIGKWYYLDQFGVEQGPSRLCKLKSLVEEGYIVADHFVKHADSERWVTVENAVSPMATVNFPSVVSDVVTQMVSPPEAPGNVLEDNCDLPQLNDHVGEDTFAPLSEIVPCHADSLAASEPSDEHHIDERVGALLEGFSVIPGRELEVIGEVLQMTFEHVEWEKWGSAEGEHCGQRSEECLLSSEAQKESTEPRTSDKENDFFCSDPAELFSGLWSCKGGDWKRNDEATQDRLWKKKLVLNDGYPLCLMSKSGIEDPRWLQKDELHYPSHSRRLDLPSWAFISPDEWNDSNIVGRPNQSKPPVLRGTKGMMLPVIRINACVVKEHGSFVSEPRTKVRGKDRHPQRSSRPYVATGDSKRSSEEGVYHSKSRQDQESHGSRKSSMPLSIPKDRLCSADELQLHLGEWYYLDGAGHERGPFSFIELQVLVDQGVVPENSSAFRKVDRIWVPVASSSKTSDLSKMSQTPSETLGASVSELESSLQSAPSGVPCTFHGMHPQFIGYTQGKLHELVMKSYKSRELAAAINEVLDPWINARQPKKESNPDFRASKKARCHGSEEEYEMEEDISVFQNDECQFDDLCGDETFNRETITKPGIENGSWGLLDDRVLARIFHFLKADVKSLVYAALTCKHWRSIVKIYKGISRHVDLLSVASSCSDSMMQKIMNGYNKEKITSLVLHDCTGITPRMLEDVLLSFSCLSCIDIRGCSQLEDVAVKFPNINWIRSRSSNLKVKSLKNISDRTSSSYRTYNSQENQMDDSIGLRDYLESSDKREFANQLFRRSLYKRAKVFDARKSSSMLSRDAQLRHLAMRKSRNCFKRMKEFLASSLREIMKENTFEVFVPKVGEIEEKIRSGYYASRGLNSAKEDISRMCRDALKSKNRGEDMNRIIASFIRLATRLEEDPKSFCTRDEMMKTWKDESPPGFSSSTTKYKKNPARMSDKKYLNRSNGSSYVNGGSDYGEFASDREIKRRLSKLRLKSLDSGSETSDDLGRSSGDTSSDSESTASETESDLDFRSECGTAESKDYFNPDDGFDSLADDREWGARMTKASLVPPVTRKYEVIDHYVIVADEKEVKRKMLVSLPEDYAEKLSAQRNGTEESDMEIPEVKDYKPRKMLGEEVIEQEVYGIDPYTHNLLLDSMSDEPDWSLLDKHLFIEDVLLSTLNKQVRRFTGSHTPMIYSLKPVFEEILENADKDQDKRTVRLCQFILKAIDTRPEDNYVAYRKGLGVVCNKEGGFSEEDFVVEFLGEVYPAWKWFEKQDGIRSLQRNNNDPAPEFYNIYLERPKGDADGYDLVVVDAMHKANYASRICHSCRPNCEAKVTAVDGQYQIGIYSVRPIAYGEEITFDYNSVTESKEEYEASVCLCGSQVCRGSYLNLTGEGAFLKVLQEYHGLLDRHQLMLEACELNSVSEEDYIDLGKAGLGSCLLAGLPHWLIAYSARLVRFINFERTKLPDEILKHNLEEKKKYFSDICLEVEKNESEIQAEGVYNQRLQNLALTLDKVRYVMRCVFGDPEKAPPPLERLSPEDAVSFIWRGEGSLVEELLQCMAPHLEDSMLSDLKAKIRAHDPSRSDDLEMGLRKSLIWLRDEVRDLPCTYKSRHDAAADLIHLYAYTKCFFRIREYKTVTSPAVYISPLDLGPKYADKLGPGIHEYRKTYGESYCLGQLICWYNQANADPENCLFRASRGCLSLPEAGSFYAKVQKPSRQRVYGPRTVKFMLSRMEKQPQRAWPKDRIWSFKSSPKVFGSPMLDGILNKAPLEKEMVHWLKHRPAIFQAKWDR